MSQVQSGRPPIRVNQFGYLAHRPKRATMITSSPAPLEFTVEDRAGAAVLTGRSDPWRDGDPDPTSGCSVHVLDMSGLPFGAGLRVRISDQRSRPFDVGTGQYGRLAADALRFFYLQRSGCPIDDVRAPGYGRPAGHLGVAPNTGDLAVPAWQGRDAEDLYPGWVERGRFDVHGGWYDAGDHGKYVTSGALPGWQLLSTVELLRRPGAQPAFVALERDLIEECRWQLDWLLRMQVPPGHPYAGLAFHRVHGTEWEPLPVWPHLDPTRRVLHRPSTAAGLALAASAAHAARVLRDDDPAYAECLLVAAATAHRAAHDHPQLIAPNDHGAHGGGPYDDADLADDIFWADTQLWLATGDHHFRESVEASPCYGRRPADFAGFDAGRLALPAHLELARAGDAASRDLVVEQATRLRQLAARQPWGQPYAPERGWDWGSNGRLLNNLVVLGTADELTGDSVFLDAVAEGMDYLLGRNALGQSYVTGYGTDFSRHQRTRHFAHDLDPGFPPPPAGALAGGPTDHDHPGFPGDPRIAGRPAQLCYLDEPTSETTNDVCIRWNAPLVWVALFLSLADTR